MIGAREDAGATQSNITREIAGKILGGGARLYGFGEAEFAKTDAAARRRNNLATATK